jgi:hypothetical protein
VRPGSPGPKPRNVKWTPKRAPSHNPRCCCFCPTTTTTDDNPARHKRSTDNKRIAAALEMSPFASRVGSDCMATLDPTPRPASDGSASRVRPKKNSSGASAQRHPIATRSLYADDRGAAATNAVATAFARIIAERYPGTSWLPVKSSRSDHRFVVPAGKVLRLLPGPADMDTDGGIWHPAAPTAH